LEVRSQINEGRSLINAERRKKERCIEQGIIWVPVAGLSLSRSAPGPATASANGKAGPSTLSPNPASIDGGRSGFKGKVMSGKEIKAAVSSTSPSSSSLSDTASRGTVTGFVGKMFGKKEAGGEGKYKSFKKKGDQEERKSFL